MSELGKNAVNVALIGAGTVGGGTLNVLTHNADIITARALPIHVRWVATLTEEEGRAAIEKAGATDVRVTTDWREAVSDPDVDIVVELAKVYGGENSPAFVNAILGKLVKGLEAAHEEDRKHI